MKKTVLIGITGGIAACKAPEIISKLVKLGIDIEVIMTHAASYIVPPHTIESITGKKVYIDLFEKGFDYNTILSRRKVDHIELAGRAALFVILPATANCIAKLATGIADDYLTTTALAATCPILVCPSMNVYMWRNPATQANVATLRSRGFLLLGPDTGMLACGYEGEGRLIDTNTLTEEIHTHVTTSHALWGKRILITSGATQEKIDDIRFITNKSSGKMGTALSESCYMRGASVLLLRSSTSSSRPRYPIEEKLFTTAEELEALIKKYAPASDVCFHAAAVSDFKLSRTYKGKLRSEKNYSLNLVPREKIVGHIKTYNPALCLIAFKAMWHGSKKDLIATASQKLHASNADFIVANEVGRAGRGFQSDTNEVYIIGKKGKPVHVALSPKREIAEHIVTYCLINGKTV